MGKSRNNSCKFCGAHGKLVDSHIIPRGFFEESHFFTSSYVGERQKRSHTGIYDQFLCDEHEKQFGLWDDYAISLLRNNPPERASDDFFVYESVDYSLLKLFFISVLWRADATSHNFFDNINIVEHRDVLKTHIETMNPGGIDDFSVMLCYSEEKETKAIIAPRMQKHIGVEFVLLYLPSFVAIVKVDEKPLPEKFRDKALNKTGKLYVEQRVFKGSFDEKIMQKVVLQNLKKKTTAYDPKNPI